MTTSQRQQLRIERVFDAPRQLVWDAWTKPELAMKWLGPEHFTCPVFEIDLRVGGNFTYCMRSPDGRDYWNGGIFEEVDPIRKIVCSIWITNENGEVVEPAAIGLSPTFPKEQKQTVTFDDLGEKTKLTIVYEVESDEVMAMLRQIQMKEGWETALEKLARSLTKEERK